MLRMLLLLLLLLLIQRLRGRVGRRGEGRIGMREVVAAGPIRVGGRRSVMG